MACHDSSELSRTVTRMWTYSPNPILGVACNGVPIGRARIRFLADLTKCEGVTSVCGGGSGGWSWGGAEGFTQDGIFQVERVVPSALVTCWQT